MRKVLAGPGDLDTFAELLHQGWELKKSLGFGISVQQVDEWFEAARRNGAVGGKLLSAGGGGFLLLMAPPGGTGRSEQLLRPPSRETRLQDRPPRQPPHLHPAVNPLGTAP